MTRSLLPYRIVAVVAGILLCSLATEAAQPPVSPAPAPSTVGEDSSAWRRDPFIGNAKKGVGAPLAKGVQPVKNTMFSKPEQDIQLQGIVQSDKSFHALINGRSVKAGDTISGMQVKEISRYKVVMLNERKEKVIYDIYQGRIDRGKQ